MNGSKSTENCFKHFLKRAKNKFGNKFDYSKSIYINAKTKILIICPIHGEFYQLPLNHLVGHGCKECGKEAGAKKITLTGNIFFKRAGKIHNNKYSYLKSVYVDYTTALTITCLMHGDFSQSPSNHLIGHGCVECSKKNSARKRSKPIAAFIIEALKKHNGYDYSKSIYVNRSAPILIICPVHGEFWQIPANHLNGAGCPKCSRSSANKKKSKYYKNFKALANIVYNFKYSYLSEYVNRSTKVLVLCKDHGKFWQAPIVHLKGFGCPGCRKELRAEKRSLSVHEFTIKSQKTFNGQCDYSLVNFKKMDDLITITCLTHGKFKQKAKHHLITGCPRCRKHEVINSTIPARKYKFIKNSVKYHGNKYTYLDLDFKNLNCAVNIGCKTHGPFSVIPHHHLGGYGCPKCKAETRYKRNAIFFKEKAGSSHNNFYDYSPVISIKSFNDIIRILCPKHNLIKVKAFSHMNGSRCRQCAYETERLTLDQFNQKAYLIHRGKYIYDLVKFCIVMDKIKIICPRHNVFTQTVASHLRGSGCPNCSKLVSRGESEWLDHLKIPSEFRNNKLTINGRSFFPDGYDTINNIIYEYNGDYWHGNPNIYPPDGINKLNKIKFSQLYEETVEKENFLKSIGLKVISIWESDWVKYKETLCKTKKL